jgi:hypothetical protein
MELAPGQSLDTDLAFCEVNHNHFFCIVPSPLCEMSSSSSVLSFASISNVLETSWMDVCHFVSFFRLGSFACSGVGDGASREDYKVAGHEAASEDCSIAGDAGALAIRECERCEIARLLAMRLL